jgi:hypothetical protein
MPVTGSKRILKPRLRLMPPDALQPPSICYPGQGVRSRARSLAARVCTGSPWETITYSNGSSSSARNAGRARSKCHGVAQTLSESFCISPDQPSNFPGSTTTTARFNAFSLSLCSDSQAIAVAFPLPVRPNPPFRSQLQSEASLLAAPPSVSVRWWFHQPL